MGKLACGLLLRLVEWRVDSRQSTVGNRRLSTVGSSRLSTSGQRGFTMVEVLVVVVIIAIAAALVGPSLESGFRTREVRSAARSIAGTLRALHGDAVLKGKIRTLVVDPERNLLSVEGRGEPIDLGEVAGILEIRGGEAQPQGGVRVSFFPNGSTSGLALAVGDREAPREGSYVVRLDPLIGLVTVRDASQ